MCKDVSVKIIGIIWLEDIVDKLLYKHNVEQHEVREVFDNAPYISLVEKGHRKGENVYAGFGQSDSGRYLIVFFVYKKDRRALIVSARDMEPVERRQYDRR
jgi:uncharacterized protein